MKLFIIRLMWFLLPRKIFRKYISDKKTMVPNPLGAQSFMYRNCGCGSRKKVKWCCGRPKYISVYNYKKLIISMELWLGEKNA